MVKYMKKVFFVLALFVLLLNVSDKRPTMTAFNSLEGFGRYNVVFTDRTFSTKQLKNHFKDISIISVTPFYSPMFQNKIIEKSYSFDTISIDKNINRFIQNQIYNLEKMGFPTEANKVQINGVYIKKMVIYCNQKDIENLKNQIPNLEYQEKF